MVPDRNLDTTSLRLVTLKAGNFGNGHIYLREIMDFFPASSVGASSEKGGTGVPVKLHLCCGESPVETDIAGDKKIFRKRFWDDFFDHHKLEVGDKVALERLSEFEYRVYPWVNKETSEIRLKEGPIIEATQIRIRYITQSVRRRVWERDHGRCVQCGSEEELEFDHIIPVSKGGASIEENVQVLCIRCNRTKGAAI